MRSNEMRQGTMEGTQAWAELSSQTDRQTEDISRRLQRSLGARAQIFEIIRHRNTMSHRLGHPVSLDEAARDWIPKFASLWRVAYQAKLKRPEYAS